MSDFDPADVINPDLADEDDGGMFDIFGFIGWPLLLAIFVVCVLRFVLFLAFLFNQFCSRDV